MKNFLKGIVKYIYLKTNGEPRLPHHVSNIPLDPLSKSIEDRPSVKGRVILKKDKKGSIEYITIRNEPGFSNWEYIKYPFWRFSYRVPKSSIRIYAFAYDFEEEN